MLSCKCDPKSRSFKSFKVCCRYSWIIIFGTVTLLLLVLTIQKVDPDKRSKMTDLRAILPHIAFMMSGCRPYYCSVICVNSSNLQMDMIQTIMETGCPNIDTFHVEKQNFPGASLQKNWAHSDIKFFEILITNGNLSNIQPEVFNSVEFTQTLSLGLEDLPISDLGGGTLLGLSKLESLSIIAPIDRISRVFFQCIRATLKTLKLNRMTESIQFDDMFGVSNMSSLEDLDLSNNRFIEPLTIVGFTHLSKVRYLDLSRSEISSIGRNAFNPIKNTLKFLDLSHNNLTRIAYGTLDSILESRRTYIYLRENNWVCDCDLVPLVRYYDMYSEVFLDIPICRAPQTFYGEPISTVEFCAESTRYTAESATYTIYGITSDETTSTDVQSSGREILIERSTMPTDISKGMITCVANSSSSVDGRVQYLYLDPASHAFSLTYLGNFSVQVDIEEMEKSITILWFRDPDIFGMLSTQTDYGCEEHSKGTIVIPNLLAGSAYTFCIIPEGQYQISPFNCIPFYIQNDTPNDCDGWISTSNKDVIIAMVCVLFLVSFGGGAATTYVIIRKHPEILRGSKRVLVMKKPKMEKKHSICIISDSVDNRPTKRCAPPPPYKKFFEEDSYEIPLEVEENQYIDEYQRCYAEPLSLAEGRPNTPPPLPKRNSEKYNTGRTTRDKFVKRSI